MDLDRIDLNLMVALEALLTERNVTRSAERLGRKQPALSASLSRLRRHFGDPLLVRRGNVYELTPKASLLRYEVRVALDAAEKVFDRQTAFDPSHIDREFVVLMSDYVMACLGPPLLDELTRSAPHVRLRFEQFDVGTFGSWAFLEHVDAMVLPYGYITDVPSKELFQDRWVCIVAADNTAVGDVLTQENMRKLPWVVTYRNALGSNPAFRALQAEGIDPTPVLTVSSFLALPDLIAGSPRISLIEERLAPRITGDGKVRAVEFPFELPPITEVLWWHPARTRHPEHTWLRARMAAASMTLD